MKYIQMNDNKYYDVDLAKLEMQIDTNTKFSETEMPSLLLLNRILESKIEMKSHMQTLKTGNLFIEFEIDNKGDGFLVPSGLSTTHSDFYFLNIDEMGLFLPVTFLKYAFTNRNNFKPKLDIKNNEKTADDHIGHGLIIPMYRLQEIYNSFVTFKEKLRLKELSAQKKKV